VWLADGIPPDAEFFATTEALLSERRRRRRQAGRTAAAAEVAMAGGTASARCPFEEGLSRYLLGAPTRVLRAGHCSALVRCEGECEGLRAGQRFALVGAKLLAWCGCKACMQDL
jgi:hypothetical protein